VSQPTKSCALSKGLISLGFTNPEGKEVLHSGTTVWTRATTITLPHADPDSKERGKEVGWVKSNLMGESSLLDQTETGLKSRQIQDWSYIPRSYHRS